jgi:hypothetical protein
MECVDSDGNTCGRKKSEIWNELSALIKEKGIVVERIPHQVGIKMCKMEGEYKKANIGSMVLARASWKREETCRTRLKRCAPTSTKFIPL